MAKHRFVERKGELRKQKGKLKKSKTLSKRDENTHDTGRGHRVAGQNDAWALLLQSQRLGFNFEL